mgnify:CR=1 FL=1
MFLMFSASVRLTNESSVGLTARGVGVKRDFPSSEKKFLNSWHSACVLSRVGNRA